MIVCFSLFVSSLILFHSFLYSLSLLSFVENPQNEISKIQKDNEAKYFKDDSIYYYLNRILLY